MERRKALALAATVTCVLGSTTVAFASVGGVSLLGFGRAESPGFSESATGVPGGRAPGAAGGRTEDVYDTVVVEGTTDAVARSAAPTPPATATTQAGDLPTGPAPAVETRSGPAPRHHRHASNAPAREHPTRAKTPSVASTTTEPTTDTTSPPDSTTPTTTTLPPVTTTTRPPGVPKDWPPGKPIPPMPPNCHHPQLEDNGVWNCGDD